MAFAVVDHSDQCPETSCQAGNPDNECACFGFDYGITKYTPGAGYEDGSGAGSTDIGVTYTYDWTATHPGVDGVLVKTGDGNNNFCQLAGGTSGFVNGSNMSVSHITFCGKDGGGCVGCCPGDPYYPTCTPPVPVFPTWTLGLAIIGVGLGLALLRKK